MAIQDAKADRGHEPPNTPPKHSKVAVEIDDSDNRGADPTPPETVTGKP